MRGPATLTDELTAPTPTTRERRDGYTLVRTEACPTFRCGNCLVLDEPPEDLDAWVARFEADLPGVEHRLVQWETDETDGGETSVNLLTSVPPLPRRADIEIRRLGDADWAAQLALASPIVEERFPGSHAYSTWMNDQRRDACRDGRAVWWGAFDGGRLVGSAGLFESDRWARFQSVLTAPTDRGRGVCTTLVHAMASEVASRRPGDQIVLVAHTDSQAERIYRSIGFERVGGQHQHSRPPRDVNSGRCAPSP